MPKKSILELAEESALPDEKPHEFLMRIVMGEPIVQKSWKVKYFKQGPRAGEFKSKELIEEKIYPTFPERMEAAKIAAPFYAPKLASSTIKEDKTIIQFLDEYGESK